MPRLQIRCPTCRFVNLTTSSKEEDRRIHGRGESARVELVAHTCYSCLYLEGCCPSCCSVPVSPETVLLHLFLRAEGLRQTFATFRVLGAGSQPGFLTVLVPLCIPVYCLSLSREGWLPGASAVLNPHPELGPKCRIPKDS